MAAEKEPDDKAMNADPWIIDGMLPIAVAHAEAEARASLPALGAVREIGAPADDLTSELPSALVLDGTTTT